MSTNGVCGSLGDGNELAHRAVSSLRGGHVGALKHLCGK
jgi:hypothetical protein